MGGPCEYFVLQIKKKEKNPENPMQIAQAGNWGFHSGWLEGDPGFVGMNEFKGHCWNILIPSAWGMAGINQNEQGLESLIN